MRNQTRKLMWLSWLVGSLLLVNLVCVAADQEIIYEPWPYGLIAYVDVDPGDHVQSDSARLVSAVQRICAFWDLPMPEPHSDWRTPFERTKHSCNSMYPTFPVTLRPSHGSEVPWYPCHTWWQDGPLGECIVALYEDHDAMASSLGRFGFRAYYMRSWPPRVAITVQDFREHEGIVIHELTHWLTSGMWRKGLLSSPMSILREGVACVTERELTDDELPTDAWTMAMLYAEEGSLVDAPLWLRHSLGETVVDVLMKQGIELDRDASWKCAASSLCDQWRALVEEINEDWSHAVSQVSTFSRADRAVYEALKQSLHLARDLLRPVLSDEAEAVYSEIAERRGTERSVDLFWELALIPPSYYLGRPDDTVWNALELRERTFVATLIARTLHAAPPAPEKVTFQGMDEVDDDVARTHIARLVGLREMGLWDAYFAEYLMLVKTIVRDGMVDPDLIPWWDPEDET